MTTQPPSSYEFVPLPDDPRIRDLRVTPHGLAGYDKLSAPDTENDNESR